MDNELQTLNQQLQAWGHTLKGKQELRRLLQNANAGLANNNQQLFNINIGQAANVRYGHTGDLVWSRSSASQIQSMDREDAVPALNSIINSLSSQIAKANDKVNDIIADIAEIQVEMQQGITSRANSKRKMGTPALKMVSSSLKSELQKRMEKELREEISADFAETYSVEMMQERESEREYEAKMADISQREKSEKNKRTLMYVAIGIVGVLAIFKMVKK